jgi:glutaminyl-peptide cyclotransferase
MNMIFKSRALPLLGILFSVLYGCNTLPPAKFDGEKAYALLQEQCDFGPRYPGSKGHAKTREYLLDKLSELTDFVKTQDFFHPGQNAKLQLTNIIASFHPDKGKRVLLCAHWDTRLFADEDPDSTLQGQPVPGANDGASGVAVLLEVARIVSLVEPAWGVDIVLFDAEDGGEKGGLPGYCLGSTHFAGNLGGYRPEFGILLDMIGDKELTVYKEGYSYSYARGYVDFIWSKAKDLKLSCFKDSIKHTVYDDHVPLLNAGIPTVDLIDFDYPYWHTTSDTPDKCSPESLQKIGDLILKVLYDKT